MKGGFMTYELLRLKIYPSIGDTYVVEVGIYNGDIERWIDDNLKNVEAYDIIDHIYTNIIPQ